MRDEVLVLSLSGDRSKTCFYLGEPDDALFHSSRKPEVFYIKRSSHGSGMRRDLKPEEEEEKEGTDSAEKMETEVLRRQELFTASPLAVEQHERTGGEAFNKHMLSLHQTQVVAPPLQWGNLKGSRCSRRPNSKPHGLVDESKTVQVEAVKGPSTTLYSSAALEENLSPKNAIVRKRDHPYSSPASATEHGDLEQEDRREKLLRRSDSTEGKKGLSVQVVKRGSLHASQQASQQRESLPVTRSSLGKRVASPDNFPAASIDGLKGSGAKFSLSLSRKEIEEDFLKLKCSRHTKRPRRRPRVPEKNVLYCTPGNRLSNVCYARYIVKEKKCVKEKPRGLKAMQSLDSDSE
ncbi:hypothetical protein GOP47_0015618 [Adiantum capillus-veneris]|uniref:Uncharacterized protein n=1 Tax=Adiantum capillus-veneris TaxID=13818 RepID=A0A9D4UKB9_ADICA|nr:hypothetical protein GOP47_0015618 [Adiantum capillus-veneris]